MSKSEHRVQPTVGRIVHYFPFGDNSEQLGHEGPPSHWAAIVTDVQGPDLIDLTSFSPGQPAYVTAYSQVPRRGTHPEGAVSTVGFWDWPPRL